MIHLYVTTSSECCRKARAWLDDHNLPYIEHNLLVNPLSITELKAILRLTEEGTTDVIAYRSLAYLKLSSRITIDDLSLNELLNMIRKNPSLIRRPIILDEKRLQVGYNEDEIRCFLPRSVRNAQFKEIKETFMLDTN